MATATQLIHVETTAARKNLKISLSTLRRAVQLLREALPADLFDKGYCERGFSFQSYQVIERYFELRRLGMPTHRAADYLKVELAKQHKQAS